MTWRAETRATLPTRSSGEVGQRGQRRATPCTNNLAPHHAPCPPYEPYASSPSRPLQSFDRRPRAARLAADGRARPFGDAGLDAEGIVERIPWPRNIRRGRRLF